MNDGIHKRFIVRIGTIVPVSNTDLGLNTTGLGTRAIDARFPLSSIEQVAEARSTGQAVVWIDLEEPTEQELGQIGKLLALDSECIEDCLHGEQRPRVDEFDEFIFLVLYGVPVRDGTPELAFRKLAAFCGARFLVTVITRRWRVERMRS